MNITIKCKDTSETKTATEILLSKNLVITANPSTCIIKIKMYRWELINLLYADEFTYFKPCTGEQDLEFNY